jgi:hypothetical protein
MFLKTEYIKTQHTRLSKLGHEHTYYRNKTVVVLRCDSCTEIFYRDKGSMDPKRLTNNVYHVCNKCDAKRFAQDKGVESRNPWDMPVSSLKKLGQL